jgi:t-SNARE complex subunit (syntaxin)
MLDIIEQRIEVTQATVVAGNIVVAQANKDAEKIRKKKRTVFIIIAVVLVIIIAIIIWYINNRRRAP